MSVTPVWAHGLIILCVRVICNRVTRGDASEETRYFHRDAIASLNRITNAAGGAVESFAYEAFGARRNANGTAQNRASPLLGITTDRGFTGPGATVIARQPANG